MTSATGPIPKTASYKTAALVALLCLIWSSTWWAIRVCLEQHTPMSSAAARYLIASLAMTLLAPMLRRRERAPSPPTWLWVVSGLTNFAGSYGILYFAETVVPSGIAAVLWAIFPLLMAGSAVCFLGEKLSARQWLGFLVSFAGIVTVFWGDLGGIAAGQMHYALLVLCSPVVAAVGTTLVKKYGSRSSSVVLNRNGMLLGAAVLAAVAFATEAPLSLEWTPQVIVATTSLALVGTTMAFGIYFWLLRTAPASLLALINYVSPVLAMVLATLTGDGSHDLLAWFGAGLVVAGVALVMRK